MSTQSEEYSHLTEAYDALQEAYDALLNAGESKMAREAENLQDDVRYKMDELEEQEQEDDKPAVTERSEEG